MMNKFSDDYAVSEKLGIPINRAVDCPANNELNTIRSTISPYLCKWRIETNLSFLEN